jgi:hypothetical protein
MHSMQRDQFRIVHLVLKKLAQDDSPSANLFAIFRANSLATRLRYVLQFACQTHPNQLNRIKKGFLIKSARLIALDILKVVF